MMGVFRDGMASARGYIERLGPYQSLLILAIPTSLVEPFKLIAVAVAGEGHWIAGTFMIIAAYGCSLVFVERLFRIVRPKLLTLPWFARLWNWVLVVRGKVVGLFRPVDHRSTAGGWNQTRSSSLPFQLRRVTGTSMSIDQRHRDKNGEISRKHGNTLVSTLRRIYGPSFAVGQSDSAKLSDVLAKLHETSLTQLIQDHESGGLDEKVRKAALA